MLVGLQASGKSTFCRLVLSEDHVVVSKDGFPNARRPQRRQMLLIGQALSEGHSVVVDNTNPSPAEWQPLIDIASAHRADAVAYWFPPDVAGCAERNAGRTGRARVPDVGLYATLKRLQQPRRADGFDRVCQVELDGAGGFRVTTPDEPAG